MPHNTRILTAAAMILSAPLLFIQCSENVNPVQQRIQTYSRDVMAKTADLNDFPVEPVSEDEAAGLMFMRQEEKLAGDIYVSLFGMWELQIFSTISESEDAHTNTIRALLDRYKLEDPVAEEQPGVFTDAALTELYSALLEKGGASLTDGLCVGAEIEEIDILDLRHQLETVVDNEDIAFVYNNLLRGSENHLRAFVTSLERQGIVYTPQHLDSRLYNEIISSADNRGGLGRRGSRW